MVGLLCVMVVWSRSSCKCRGVKRLCAPPVYVCVACFTASLFSVRLICLLLLLKVVVLSADLPICLVDVGVEMFALLLYAVCIFPVVHIYFLYIFFLCV